MQLEQVLEALYATGVDMPVAWSRPSEAKPDDPKGLAVTFPNGKTTVAPFGFVVPTLLNALYDLAPEHPLCTPEPGHHYLEREPAKGKEPQQAETTDLALSRDGSVNVIFKSSGIKCVLPVGEFLKIWRLEQ